MYKNTTFYTLSLEGSTVSTFTLDDLTQLQWYPAPKASHATRSPLHHVIPGGHILTVAVEHHHEALMIILREGPAATSEVSEKTEIFSADIKLKMDNTSISFLMSVWPCIVVDMKRVKPTRCYPMVYWTLWVAQHVSGITMPIIRSSRLYKWTQHMAPHLGYGSIVMPETCWAIHKIQ